jgi:hypothetical protein
MNKISTNARINFRERALGEIILKDMKWYEHIDTRYELGQIIYSFTHLNENSMNLLYTSLVRPHLDFAAPIWNLVLHK